MVTPTSTRRAIVLLLVLLAGIVVVTIWLLRRSGRPPAPASDAGVESSPGAAPYRPLPSVPRNPEPVAVPDASVDGSADGGAKAVPYRSWRSVLIEQQNRNIRDVDEYLFNQLRYPDDVREAIRQVNESYSRKIEAEALSPKGIANKTVNEHERKVALGKVLGPRSNAFINAEYREMRRLRQIYHRQFLRKQER